jgi:hypothetical protein
MASTPEALVKAKVRAILKAAGIYFFSPATWGMGRAGVPDLICCVNGRFLAIECKAGKGKTTALQEAEIANIRASGGIALVITEYDLDLLRSVIRTLHGMLPILIVAPTPTQDDPDEDIPPMPAPTRVSRA